MDFVLTTGDSADNQQRNENEWVVELLEGGDAQPNSGVRTARCPSGLPDAEGRPGRATRASRTTTTTDRRPTPSTTPTSRAARRPTGPRYTGLMDRAQQAVRHGRASTVPSYVAFGNHDGLVQGNQASTLAFEGDRARLRSSRSGRTPRIGAISWSACRARSPPDPNRQPTSTRPQYKALHRAGTQADAHGFAYIDPAENWPPPTAPPRYYAWCPAPGVRFIASRHGVRGRRRRPVGRRQPRRPAVPVARANELAAAKRARRADRRLRPPPDPRLTANVPTRRRRRARPTQPRPRINPGCDLDPRDSSPIHLGADLGR